MNILIINGTSWHNIGDASITTAEINSIQKEFGDEAKITLSMFDFSEANRFGFRDVKFVQNPFSAYARKFKSNVMKSILILSLMFFLTLQIILYRVFGRLFSSSFFLQSMIDSEIIVSTGGSIFNDFCGIRGFATNFFTLILAILCGKKVVLYSQTIGPFKNSLLKFIFFIVAKRVSLVLVRERESLNLIKREKIDVKTELLYDQSFLMEGVSKMDAKKLLLEEGVKFDRPIVGMTLIERVSVYSGNKCAVNNYISEMRKVINILVNEYNLRVVIFPFCNKNLGMDKSDLSFVKKNFSDISQEVTIIDGDYTPQEMKSMAGLVQYFIGTRLHSNLFAFSNLIPTIAINNLYKTSGIMELFDMQDYVVDYDRIRVEKVIDLFENIRKNRVSIIKKINSNLSKARKYANGTNFIRGLKK